MIANSFLAIRGRLARLASSSTNILASSRYVVSLSFGVPLAEAQAGTSNHFRLWSWQHSQRSESPLSCHNARCDVSTYHLSFTMTTLSLYIDPVQVRRVSNGFHFFMPLCHSLDSFKTRTANFCVDTRLSGGSSAPRNCGPSPCGQASHAP